MNEIKVTTELCAEDRALLHNIHKVMTELSIEVRALRDVNAPVINIQTAEMPLDIMAASSGIGIGKVAETKDHGDFVEIVTEPEEPETPEEVETPEETEEPAAPQHTKAELQPKVVSLVSAGKKEEVKEIIKQYAAKVSDIPEDKVDEVWAKLEQLEG